MNYLKIILLLILFSNVLNASMLLDKNYPLCIEDYYVKGGALYYIRSSDNILSSTTEDHAAEKILHNYTYDSINNICAPDGINSLGLESTQYNFLLALCGLLFGGIFMFFTVQAFTNVGGKK